MIVQLYPWVLGSWHNQFVSGLWPCFNEYLPAKFELAATGTVERMGNEGKGSRGGIAKCDLCVKWQSLNTSHREVVRCSVERVIFQKRRI
jgi:hypothetical protein